MKDYCVITAYFNLDNNPYRLKNYKFFAEKLKKQGIPLICAEASVNESFALDKNDADILIQKRTNCFIWHKEALLNLCLDYLPKNIKYVFWIDCDVYFKDPRWITKAIKALDIYDIIQPFENAYYTNKYGKVERKTKSAGYYGKTISEGFSGYAWGTKRAIIDSIRFYDKAIFGAYDYLFLSQFQRKKLDFISQRLKQDFFSWALEKDIAQYTFGYAKNNIYHLWHAEDKNRLRKFRHRIEEYCKYKPWEDIQKKNGLYTFVKKKSLLETLAKDYLLYRSKPTVSRKLRLGLFEVGVARNPFIKKTKHLELKKQENIPQFPKKLSGTFYAITTFYNPFNEDIKYQNYNIFRKNLQKQHIKLIAIELSFNNNPFELKKNDADIVMQIKGNDKNILWQKEALLNIGLNNLPKDCDKVAWLDCDIIFKNNNWVKETSKLLETYVLVQPFDTVIRLKKNKINMSNQEISKTKLGLGNGYKSKSVAWTVHTYGRVARMIKPKEAGHTGFAWAARRECLEEIKFYDRNIIYTSDTLMADAFYGLPYSNYVGTSQKGFNDYKIWAKKAFKHVNKSVFFTQGTILHLWHGEVYRRKIIGRNFLSKYNFDPKRDIKKNAKGIWEWSNPEKKTLQKKVLSYFNNYENAPIRRYILNIWATLVYYQRDNFFEYIGKIGEFIKNHNKSLHTWLVKRKPDFLKE